MAIFSSGKFGADTGSSALSRGRIEAALKSKQWAYQVDKDGDVGGYWSGHLFYFFVTGEKNEILHIQGRWKESLDVERRLEVRQAIDEWHRDKFWPKAYTRVNDSGELQVYAELAVDFEPGVTDDLLAQTILCALVTSLRLFEHLAEHFGLPPSDD
ncbi:MAG: YbjN domain-containing protein [Propionibacteriaceae bacterium]|jgi:hypothetical protein|nr:YbjN domain-containing protein [Propionibacteriaceae bacterium]